VHKGTSKEGDLIDRASLIMKIIPGLEAALILWVVEEFQKDSDKA
jgi:hypothetical protein